MDQFNNHEEKKDKLGILTLTTNHIISWSVFSKIVWIIAECVEEIDVQNKALNVELMT